MESNFFLIILIQKRKLNKKIQNLINYLIS